MAGAHTLEFTDANFDQEVIQSDQPALVDFWAEWCGPCKALGPVIDDLATTYAGKAKVGKVNVDVNANLAVRFTVSGIPTVLLFAKGQLVERIQGFDGKTKGVIVAALDRACKG